MFDTDLLNFVYRFLECPVQHPPRNSCGAKQMFVLREFAELIPRGSPPVARGRGFSLTDRLPPLGRRGSLVELQQRGLEELDRKRLKTQGEALGFIFFF